MECKKIMRLLSLGAGLTAVALPSGVFAGRLQSATQQSETQADNTMANKQENGTGTADQQKENPADREVARKIRQAIIEDKSLSTYAHNVKIIVRGGQVTLKGPVRSEDEKSNIATKAAEIAGADKVQNELTIKS